MTLAVCNEYPLILKDSDELSGVKVTRNRLVVKLEFCIQLFRELDSNSRVPMTPEIFRHAANSRTRRHGENIIEMPWERGVLIGRVGTKTEAFLDDHQLFRRVREYRRAKLWRKAAVKTEERGKGSDRYVVMWREKRKLDDGWSCVCPTLK